MRFRRRAHSHVADRVGAEIEPGEIGEQRMGGPHARSRVADLAAAEDPQPSPRPTDARAATSSSSHPPQITG
ncbi:hypothetical protein [Nannocystis pusilla]|uniref:hypothetical protein n=1 Tax=Nannocystis pusilla TaxID=889268 RepID=UPI003BF42BA4